MTQSMCNAAGIVAGLAPSECSDPDGPCRYHMGVEDVIATLNVKRYTPHNADDGPHEWTALDTCFRAKDGTKRGHGTLFVHVRCNNPRCWGEALIGAFTVGELLTLRGPS